MAANRSTRFLGVTFTILLAASAARSDVVPPETRKAAPEFALVDGSGSAVKLGNYKGRVVLLNFWATWCHGCKQELPWFVEFEKSYEGRGLAVVGASTDKDGWKSVKPYLKKRPLNFPVVLAGSKLIEMYGLQSMPMTVLIDRQGRIAAIYQGVIDRNACEKDLQTLLQESSARP